MENQEGYYAHNDPLEPEALEFLALAAVAVSAATIERAITVKKSTLNLALLAMRAFLFYSTRKRPPPPPAARGGRDLREGKVSDHAEENGLEAEEAVVAAAVSAAGRRALSQLGSFFTGQCWHSSNVPGTLLGTSSSSFSFPLQPAG